MIYLDYAATTPVDGRALAAMNECAAAAWQNPSAAYSAAGEARRALRQAREALGALLNAPPQWVVFTSGGTESNNQAVALARGGHGVVSAIEHASVLNAARALCREVTLVPPDGEGVVSPEAVAAAIRPDTKLISVQLANNETGVIQPAVEIGRLARSRHIPYHCDAVQAVGHIPVDVMALNADLLSLSAHKLYGPRGAGALIVRPGTPLPPLLYGGGQELGLRAGTENVPAIAGLGAAAALAGEDLSDQARLEQALLEDFVLEVRRRVPGVRRLGEGARRLPGVAALLLPGIASEEAVARLDLLGIQVSGGAACASRERAVSHVYRAMNLTQAEAARVIRVSIGRGTTKEALRVAAEGIGKVAGRMVSG